MINVLMIMILTIYLLLFRSEWIMDLTLEKSIQVLNDAPLVYKQLFQQNPGYLIRLSEFLYCLQVEDSESEELTKLADLIVKIARCWVLNSDNYPKILYPDVIMRARSLLGPILATSFNVITKEMLLTYVKDFENSADKLTEEDCLSSANTMLTFISSTTAHTPTKAADATSSRKRKLPQEFDLDELFDEEFGLENSQYPTSKISSFISSSFSFIHIPSSYSLNLLG